MNLILKDEIEKNLIKKKTWVNWVNSLNLQSMSWEYDKSIKNLILNIKIIIIKEKHWLKKKYYFNE
jgi:hypothetical protein